MHVAEEIVEVIRLHHRDHVVRRRRQRIDRHREDHAADLGVRHDLVCELRRKCRSDELMMAGLIEVREAQLFARRHDATREQRLVQDGVDLIEGQPVLDLVLVARKDRAHIALVEADELVAGPAVVGLREVQRRLVV